MDRGQLAAELTAATTILRDRCLFEAAKWSAEALNGVYNSAEEPDLTTSYRNEANLPQYLQYPVPSRHLMMAQSYFNCREFDRCAWVLEKCTNDPTAVFLRVYARYLWGEKAKEESYQGILSSQDNGEPNKRVGPLLKLLRSCTPAVQQDPFVQYITGVLHRRHQNEKEAVFHLVSSVNAFPYNWSAWQELLQCLSTQDEFYLLLPKIADHPMKQMFSLHVRQEFHMVDGGGIVGQNQHQDQLGHGEEADQTTLGLLQSLQSQFPSMLYLNVQKALMDHHALNYEDAEREFQQVLQKDPHRLDDMDTYSNILYVLEKTRDLSYLAQIANATDKFRPESCCIIANYYSLKSQHQLAILYYQRALTLDRSCFWAWTLMGHEFMELKNAQAAIECYRRVVDVKRHDYRAWYALGQAYELQELSYYAIYYYQRAIALQPSDARTWLALAACYEKLNRLPEAIKALKRAVPVSEEAVPIMYQVGKLYERTNDMDSAMAYMEECVSEQQYFVQQQQQQNNPESSFNNGGSRNNGSGSGSGTVGRSPSTPGNPAINNNNNNNTNNNEIEGVDDATLEAMSQARLWLANFEFGRGNYSVAETHARMVTKASATEYEDARSIVRECRARLR